jgi:predicted amidohydrolase YtcJ
MTGLLVRGAEVNGRAPVDVRIAGGVVTEIALDLAAGEPEHVIDAHGGALLPGLCDHHLHLHAMAAAAASVPCGPPAVTSSAALAAALATAPADEGGWVRGTGYTEDVAGLLDADGLDHLHRDRPVRLQHRSGALWIVNTAGARALGLAGGEHPGIERDGRGAPTGRLWRADDWLRARLPRSRPPDLATTGARLARLGITHVTDATPDLDATAIDAIRTAMASGALPQHVQLLGAPLAWAPAAEPRTPTSGPRFPAAGPRPSSARRRSSPAWPHSPTAGPFKIIIADSALPDIDTLTERIRTAHRHGRAVAVHCVTREALVLLLAALDEAGTRPGDRIEHAALVPAELIPRLRDLSLTVVTQPGFLAERGDEYRRDLPAAELGDLYRARSLLDSGVGFALSSDAPYGPLDPWTVISAAIHRSTPSGHVIGPPERLTPTQALAGFLKRGLCVIGVAQATPITHGVRESGRIAAGSPADLVLLHVPLAEALAAPSADLVAATLISGSPVPKA